MKTIKLNIKSNTDDFSEYIHQATGLFYKMYSNIELIEDKEFRLKCLKEFNLFDVSMYDSCKSDVLTKKEQTLSINKNKMIELDRINKVIESDDFKSKKVKYNLLKKRSTLLRNKDKEICFGGKALLRNITEQKQKLKYLKTEKEIKECNDLINKYLKEFKENRRLNIYIIGRSCEGGNRKYDFDLTNNRIIFKPNSKFKTELTVSVKNGRKNEFIKLQNMILNNEISVTVRLSYNNICLTYDEQLLSGYNFDLKAYKLEISKFKKEEKAEKNEIYKKYIKEQEERKLYNKISTRYMSVDLNPEEISVVIADKKSKEIIDVIMEDDILYQKVISLKKLTKRLKKSSGNKEQIYQNSKRKHEIKEVWNYIFNLATHYKVGYFCIEDLDIKTSSKDENTKYFNRLVNNTWNLGLTKQLITRHLNEKGIILINVQPHYSSFVGNMIYTKYDPVSSALELCRRGMYKYTKGYSLFPSISSINQEKLNYLLGENVNMKWIEIYKLITSSGLRYRNKSIKDLSVKNLISNKSKILLLNCV